MNDEIFAICCLIALSLLVITERKIILSLSTLGAFFASHIVLVVIGLLATPWLIDTYLPVSFPYLHVEYFSQADVIKAIALVTGGLTFVVVGYRIAMVLDRGGQHTMAALGLLDHTHPIAGIGIRFPAFTISLLICLSLVGIVFTVEFPSIRAAIAANLQGETYYHARQAIDQHGRLFAYAALNVLPFLAACIAGTSWFSRRHRWIAYVAILIASLVSILSFKKIYLLDQLLAFVAIWYVIYLDRRRWRLQDLPHGLFLRNIRYVIPKGPLLLILAAFFLFVSGSYYLVAAGGLSFTLAIGFAFERVFSRLTMTALMYAHYFPGIEGHYGLQNVGLFSELAGTRLFEDTVVTVQYFSRIPDLDGSGACGAIVDFYGAFGWSGWIILSILLGGLLYAIDHYLMRLAPLLVNRVFHIFVLITVTFLAQASVFRTLSTYGGGVLLALWILVSNRRNRPLTPESRPIPSPSNRASNERA